VKCEVPLEPDHPAGKVRVFLYFAKATGVDVELGISVMNPEIFRLWGDLSISGYGVMVVAGLLAFLAISLKDRALMRLIDVGILLDAVVVGTVAGVVGCRMLFVLEHLGDFAGRWHEVAYVWDGGGSLLGGIIAIACTEVAFFRWKRVSVLPVLDAVAPGLAIMQSIARIGCLWAGCCHGAQAPGHTAWWTITYEHPDSFAPLWVPLHPVQLYAAVGMLAVFLILWLVRRRRPVTGVVLGLYLGLNASVRFATDFWRGAREPVIWWLTTPQLIAIVLACVGFLGVFISVLRARRGPAHRV
jgi:phosphatidylglycerol---prolipoprotein diacylglyceryl transferase